MTDYTDLIARLRMPWPNAENVEEVTIPVFALDLCDEAANAIAALTAERDALIRDIRSAQSALSEFATENEQLRTALSDKNASFSYSYEGGGHGGVAEPISGPLVYIMEFKGGGGPAKP